MPSVYDRIPRTPFDANEALAQRAHLALGRNTRLVRSDDGSVNLTYHGTVIAGYQRDGSIWVRAPYRPTRGVAAHLRRIFPPPWEVRFFGRSRRMRRSRPQVEAVFDGGYRLRLREGGYVLCTNGDVMDRGYRITYASLCHSAAEQPNGFAVNGIQEPPEWSIMSHRDPETAIFDVPVATDAIRRTAERLRERYEAEMVYENEAVALQRMTPAASPPLQAWLDELDARPPEQRTFAYDARPPRPYCLNSQPRSPYVCTRPQGHDGRHAALDVRSVPAWSHERIDSPDD